MKSIKSTLCLSLTFIMFLGVSCTPEPEVVGPCGNIPANTMTVDGHTLVLTNQSIDHNGANFQVYLSNENNVSPPGTEVIVMLYAYDGGADNQLDLGEYTFMPLGSTYTSGKKFYGALYFNNSLDYMIDSVSTIHIEAVTVTEVKGKTYCRLKNNYNPQDTKDLCINFQNAIIY